MTPSEHTTPSDKLMEITADEIAILRASKHQDHVKLMLEAGLSLQAKDYDKKYNVGFFAKTTKTRVWLDKFITSDPEMLSLKETILKLADPTITDPVLIIGETGTGKELLAHALHADKAGNFVEINCAGMPRELIESELFGYEKGAFTGAKTGGDVGLIELAGLDKAGNKSRGTLFLDEIGELDLTVQAKLLRVLNDKRVRKVGGKESKEVDFRLVCATHCNLNNRERFREDLYWRISTFEVKTKPLRERQDDIELIARHILPNLDNLGVAVWDKKHTWPGNVRELQRVLRRLEVLEKSQE